ncbi:hypothetical protein A2634_01295 [Candidatus Amesbacteria bacterium RIFCSPHIGHO2_01_FULL_48_32]|uniref:Uncharacterized protein n=1 Tax=Candidatus Amesbacteria bacterium RIFCSPLOWO2_01_FULL_48_25 TaxID=1797259 RepID=A0A1F4ZD79_9BACT|nr:MAG: hypothetical protein A2634_01295 [Candidatus Amesbacteria bacterium RIFCSPHIGHO2_01_FULL_48_32]OGD03677.1 MAG: hypothetical protein A2989_03280 [Candidatus Amesbacteria bacterium RIFCSPLOWO2_01_FULL_48_25]HJZ05974.1 hypothetical protein [Patescibacteria group bacterium]
MQVKLVRNPWETSFENLTTKVHKSVKKAASDATKTIAADVKSSFAEAPADKQVAQANLQAVQQEVKPEEKKKLDQWRRNLADLEAQIKKAREERLKKEQALRQAQGERAEKKKVEEKKKKEEPVWKKMMKMGSQAERKVNAGG